MSEPLHVLLVDDSETDAKLLIQALRPLGRSIDHERVEDAESMRDALGRRKWDVALADWSMPRFSALGALGVLKESGLDLALIIVSGTVGEELIADVMRAGASDFVLKDRLGRLVPAVERAMRESDERAMRRRAEATLRETEHQLRHAQKMEAIGRLAGGVAHDFNNMLSVILSYAEMLIEEPRPEEAVRDGLEEIRRAGMRAAALTRQLLLFSRQQVVEPRVLDLNDVLSGLDKMLRRLVGEDVDLVWAPAQPLGLVRVDPGAIEQVIMNLVVNARDAMPTGGKLKVETANVALDEEHARAHRAAEAGEYVLLNVTDTGTGMDTATLSRIFEPFFTTKERGKGTGLGLSTALGIVQQSGGSIAVESEIGRGTTFAVYLPRVHAAAEAARSSTAPTTLRGTETILLVEDEDQVRDVARGILLRCGYTILEGRNAAEAILLSAGHAGTIHLLLTDVVMPRMNGPELARRLSEKRPAMKVLCMSGYADDQTLGRSATGSGLPFVHKPLTVESLSRRVREVLGS
ncbi:MAG: response regulator [Polyangiaceae bacterium]